MLRLKASLYTIQKSYIYFWKKIICTFKLRNLRGRALSANSPDPLGDLLLQSPYWGLPVSPPPSLHVVNIDRSVSSGHFVVIRAKVESVIRKKGWRYLRVRVTKTFKKGKVKINKRQLIEVRSLKVTCKCTRLLPRKTYLILSKEDRHKRKLYIDALTTALEWSNDAKRYLRMYRKKALCPLRARPSK